MVKKPTLFGVTNHKRTRRTNQRTEYNNINYMKKPKLSNKTTIRGVKFEKTLKPDNQPIPQKTRIKAVHSQEVWKERNPQLYSSWLKHLRYSVKNPTDTKLYNPALLDETGNKTGTCVGTQHHRR